MSIPERSVDQRVVALQWANEVRTRRAVLKRDLKAGKASAVDTFNSTEPYLQTMRVFTVLLAMPSVGRVKANRMLRELRISPSKTIGGLSDRQREELTRYLQIGHTWDERRRMAA